MRRFGAIRAEHLLPLACLGAAALLFASELSTTFHLELGGREILPPAGSADTLDSAQRHNYAMLVLGAFAFLAVLVAVGGSRPAAAVVAVTGAVALILFLLIDLPDAGQVGSVSAEVRPNAKLVPSTGFWLELIGSLVLAICGGALATLDREQLQMLPRALGGVRRGRRAEPAVSPVATADQAHAELSSSGGENRAWQGRREGRRRERT